MKSKILITGASGLIGIKLSDKLVSLGYEVAHLNRKPNPSSSYKTFTWDLHNGKIEEGALDNVDYIIHLAGAGVADKRWSESRKHELVASRVESAELLFKHIKKKKVRLSAFISASAIGIYGFNTGERVMQEDKGIYGNDFLAELVKSWEESADRFRQLNCRVVKLRIGLVLSAKGGLLLRLLPVAKKGLSAPFGSGAQYMSWIHIDDLVNMFVESLENHVIQGAYNAVAPNPVTNNEFLKTLAKVLSKPYFLPGIPKFLISLGFGEMAEVVTGGNNVSSNKIENTGYRFQYPKLEPALKDLLLQEGLISKDLGLPSRP